MIKTDRIVFSVIVPTFDRTVALHHCLRALAEQDYPKNLFEVIVVDDGSTQPPEETIVSFEKSMNLHFTKVAHAGPAAARNAGVALANGVFLAFVDDDCCPASDWLKNLSLRLTDSPNDCIVGRTINAVPENICSLASQTLIDYLFSYYNAEASDARFLTSNNFAVAKDKFRDAKGFDGTFHQAGGEDREFCDRWLYLDRRVTYAQEVIVRHYHRLSLSRYWQQHYRYGRGAFQYHQIRARRSNERIKLEPLKFYVGMFGHVARLSESWLWRARLKLLLLLAQIANAMGFGMAALSRGGKSSGEEASLAHRSV